MQKNWFKGIMNLVIEFLLIHQISEELIILWCFKGAYDDEASAAQAYDLAALKYWGPGTVINFKVLQLIKNNMQLSCEVIN